MIIAGAWDGSGEGDAEGVMAATWFVYGLGLESGFGLVYAYGLGIA